MTGLGEVVGGGVLVFAGEWEDHAPVPPLDVAMPCATRGLLDGGFVVEAEGVEVCVAGNGDALTCSAGFTGVAAHDLFDEARVSGGVGFGLVRFEGGVPEELFSGTCDCEAVIGVFGGRFAG